ncbi:MAG: outer membrane beta-barrel family protein [Flavobacteriaceae bacterium]
MKLLLVLLTLVLSFNYSFSQNTYNLSGKVTDEKNNSISVGNILLLKNDSIIKYTSLINGHFSLESIPQENYNLKIASLGYKTHLQKITLDTDLQLTIILKEATIELDEVEIKATKRLIENKNGNIIVNIENTILSKESSTISLLSKLPSIQIAPDKESISVIGKGNPLLYISGQRISINEFKSLQIDNIKTIEIINNPSAKYEAEGRSVILITLRKKSGNRTKISLTETVSFKTYFNNYLSANLNTKKNNLELKFDITYNQLKVWESNSLDYQIINKNIQSNYLVEAVTTRPKFVFGGGLYYQLNETDYISASSSFRTQKDPFYIDTNTFLNDNGVENNIHSYSDNIGRRRFSSSNINYLIALNKTSNLFTGMQYTYYNKSIENTIKNTYDNPARETFLNRFQDFKVGSFSAKADYDISFKKDKRLELGINYTNTKSESLSEIEEASTNYKYTENNTGLYSQFSGTFKKINYSFGVRVEDTKVTAGYEQNNTLEIDRITFFLFPKGNINFSIDSTKTVTMNYSKSISRPNYSTATSTAAFINPVLEFRGNILLKPTLTDEISATFQYKDKLLTVQYTYMKDPVHYSLIYNEATDISVMFPSNFKEEYGFALNLNIPFKYKFWSSTNFISLNFNTINDTRAVTLSTSPYLYFYTNHQFKINNTTSLNINGWGLTNRQEGVFDRDEVYVLNASFNKNFFKKLEVTLSLNDIFNSMEFKDRYILQNVNAASIFYTDVHEASISLKYNFGNIKKSAYKNKNVDDNLDRIK